MPIYTLRCKRCAHVTEKGFTVDGFVAQKAQGFRFVSCGRCNRKAVLEHDFISDVKTQVVHNDEYTFSENAPEEHLVGKTVTKNEAKKILKKHGLVEVGKSGKKAVGAGTRRYTESEIVKRWEEGRAQKAKPAKEPEEVIVLATEDKQVDTPSPERDTIIAKTWPALKKQAKSLGIKVPPTTKRAELEQLVRAKLAS